MDIADIFRFDSESECILNQNKIGDSKWIL